MIIGNKEGLPTNWCLSSISEFARINPTIKKAEIPDELEVSFVPMASVQPENGNIDVSSIRKFSEVKKGYTPFIEEDVLFAKITPCMENGKMAVAPALKNNIGFGSTEFHVLRSATGISPYYLYYYVSSKSFRKLAEHYMTGAVGQKRVTAPYLSNCKIPIPPTNEQHRIVAKIEALFSELDKGIESFKTAREQLKIYRQALLKHAFSGKLTEQWRAENAGKLESAETLLQRIQTERQQRYQQQLKDWEANGKQGSKPKAPKTLPPLTVEELAELPDLPEGWAWVKIDKYCDIIPNSIKAGPFGSALKKEFYVQDGYKIYGQEQVISGDWNYGEYFIDEAKYRELENCKVKPFDILLSLVGTVGKVLVLPEDIRPGIINPRLIKITPDLKVVVPEFFKHYFESAFLKGLYKLETHGATMDVLNLGIIQSLPFPICSILEQQELIQELEARFSMVDQLDQTITTAQQQAEALRQSILKRAFSGQLVSQDPNDEPASVLLERIRTEKAAQTVQIKPTRTPKRKATA